MTMTPQRAGRIKRTRSAAAGTATVPRISVQRTSKHFRVQLIDDRAGRSLAAASDQTTKGATGTQQAEAVGTKLAEIAAQIGVKQAVLDRRGYRYHGRVKAFAEAARAAGLRI